MRLLTFAAIAICFMVSCGPPASAAEGTSLLAGEDTISIAQVKALSDARLADRITRATGVSVTVKKTELLAALEERGPFTVPVVVAVGSRTEGGVTPMAVPNDARVKYNRPLNGNGRASLKVCKSWGSSACGSSSPTGWLYNNENSGTKFGWSDTDGYHHPSSACMTQASALGLYYQNEIVGWVKLSGLWGGTWLVQMWCD